MTRAVPEPDRWHRIDELFSAALELPAAQRPGWLDAACAGDRELRREIESLLAEDVTNAPNGGIGAVVQNVAKSLPVDNQCGFEMQPGMEIGPWRLERTLGEGGMGSVWLAKRTGQDFTQLVALKLLRSEARSHLLAGRFAQERRILAGLQHPNVASFIDGGASRTEQPYFVMEYVEGEPITTFADARKLSLDARLDLFLKVCDAVRYAHQRMVIHRDIKPSNILVTRDGVPKLLDFGIAKLLDAGPVPDTLGETSATMRMYTPDYASPEQVRGDPVSASTDVYQLGAVLYELSTGHKPHRLTRNDPMEIARAICETAVTAPRSRNRQIPGDLEVVILKSLAKEPARRYQSVEEFSEDLRRYRAGQPIAARRDSLLYRGRKFVRRNWLPLAAASLGLAALAAGLVSSLLSARRAEHRFQQVRKLANHFVFDFDKEIRQIPGTTKARAMLVTTATEYLDSLAQEASGDGGLQLEVAMAYQNVADVQGMTGQPNLGRPADALASYHKSVAILRRLHQDSPAVVDYGRSLALCLERLSFLQIFTGDRESARRGLLEALSLMQNSIRSRKPEAPDLRLLANGYVYLSQLEIDEQNAVAAVAAARSGVEWMRKNAQANPILRSRSDLARAVGQLGSVLVVRGDLEAAQTYLVEDVKLRQAIVREAPNHTENLREMSTIELNLEDLFGGWPGPNLQQPEVAMTYCKDALVIVEKLATADPQNASAIQDLAGSYGKMADLIAGSDPRGALALYRKVMSLAGTLPAGSGDDARDLRAKWGTHISYVLLATGDLAGARKSSAEALAANLDLVNRKGAGRNPSPEDSRYLSRAYLAAGNTELEAHDPTAAREHFSTAAKLMERFRNLALTDLELAVDLANTWEALEHFPEERAARQALRVQLWRQWNQTLPSVYTQREEERAAKPVK